jgi:hypothetical protein
MRFNANRLASLAGIKTDSNGSLNEASNRSYHDDVANDDAVDRFGKNQLAERKHEDEDLEEAEHKGDDVEEEITLEIDEKMLRNEIRKMRAERIAGKNLRNRKKNAIQEKRSARPKRTKQSIQEAKLRQAIRNEIQGIFEELNSENITSSWLYGDDQPQNSKKGFVNTMFPGVGFR